MVPYTAPAAFWSSVVREDQVLSFWITACWCDEEILFIKFLHWFFPAGPVFSKLSNCCSLLSQGTTGSPRYWKFLAKTGLIASDQLTGGMVMSLGQEIVNFAGL